MSTNPPNLIVRSTALGLALLVLALAMGSVSPDWHAWLHGHRFCEHEKLTASAQAPHPFAMPVGKTVPAPADHEAPFGAADHVCAISLFAQGVLTVLTVITVSAGLRVGVIECLAGEISRGWQRPAYWHRPALAPPLG